MHLAKLSFSPLWLTLAIAGLAMCWPAPLERMDANTSTGVDYYNPLANGGSMLIDAGWGFGEPLNVIISGLSSAQVLTDKGFVNYARAIGFSKECLGIHLGDPMPANLGDGNGWVNQTMELRQHYGNIVFGTCWESLVGGNHFRMYRQDGSQAPSKALFLAVSKEENVTAHHTIVTDGYNIGRDDLAARAAGITSFLGIKYNTIARNVSGLLAPGSEGVNHGAVFSKTLIQYLIVVKGIATDGITTVLTVTIV